MFYGYCPFRFSDGDDDESRGWHPPSYDGYRGCIPLWVPRSAGVHGQFEGSYFVCYETQPVAPEIEWLANSLADTLKGPTVDAWAAHAQFPISPGRGKIPELLQNEFKGRLANPDGEDGGIMRPLRPGHQGFKLALPGGLDGTLPNGVVIRTRRFDADRDPTWPVIQATMRRDYRKVRDEALNVRFASTPADVHCKFLWAKQRACKVDYRLLIPDDLPDEPPVPPTTTVNETWPGADQDDPSGLQTWTEVGASALDFDRLSNQLHDLKQASNVDGSCRCETPVSTDEHTSAATISFENGSTIAGGLMNRFAAAAFTGYSGRGSASGDNQVIQKWDAETPTALDNTAHTLGAGDFAVSFSSDSADLHTLTFDGQETSASNGDVGAGNLRGGVQARRSSVAARGTHWDDWSLTDIAAGGATISRTVSETMDLSTAAQRIANPLRRVSETIDISTAAQRICDPRRITAETLALSDAALRICNPRRIVTETMDISDELSRAVVKLILILVSENLAVSDEVDRLLTKLIVVSETLGITDTVQRVADALRIATETMGISDEASRIAHALRIVSETLGISDEASRIANALRIVSETTALSDSALRAIVRRILVSETMGVTDAATVATVVVTVFLLYWAETDGARIARAAIDGTGAETIVSSTNPLWVDIDTTNGKIYWSNSGVAPNIIERSDLDGANQETVDSNVSGPDGIAVDLVNNKVIYVQAGNIKRADLDGSNSETIISGETNPKDLFVDAVNSQLWYSDNVAGLIRRSRLDGTGLVTAFSTQDPSAIHLYQDKIYWIDGTDKEIMRADRDGTNQETLFTGLLFPISLFVYLDQIYWSDVTDDVIYRGDIDGTNKTALISGLTNPFGLTINVVPDITAFLGILCIAHELGTRPGLGYESAVRPGMVHEQAARPGIVHEFVEKC